MVPAPKGGSSEERLAMDESLTGDQLHRNE